MSQHEDGLKSEQELFNEGFTCDYVKGYLRGVRDGLERAAEECVDVNAMYWYRRNVVGKAIAARIRALFRGEK